MTNKSTIFEVVKGNITKIEVDAIVNPANRNYLHGGGGISGAITFAAGPEFIEKCLSLKGCEVGEAKITEGYDLPAKYIIHTTGVRWQDGNHNEAELLKLFYESILNLAKEYNIKTIAIPAVSSGSFCYPAEEACKIAVDTVWDFIEHNDCFTKIVFIEKFDDKKIEIYNKLLQEKSCKE